jgi:hypothetical protein
MPKALRQEQISARPVSFTTEGIYATSWVRSAAPNCEFKPFNYTSCDG